MALTCVNVDVAASFISRVMGPFASVNKVFFSHQPYLHYIVADSLPSGRDQLARENSRRLLIYSPMLHTYIGLVIQQGTSTRLDFIKASED